MTRSIFCIVVALCLNTSLALCDGLPSSRFILRQGEALDQTTKLIWRRCSIGSTWHKGGGCEGTPKLMDFNDAKVHEKEAGNGWRIPTIQELYSIIEHKDRGPAINTEVFPEGINSDEEAPYWTVSRVAELPMLFYFINFQNGLVDGHSQGFVMALRLVRNAPSPSFLK